MSMHRPHPIDSDPPDAVLFDGCERCEEHADRPWLSLDEHHLRVLWVRMLEREQKQQGEGPLTYLEEVACSRLHGVGVFLERHTDVWPWAWPIRTRGNP